MQSAKILKLSPKMMHLVPHSAKFWIELTNDALFVPNRKIHRNHLAQNSPLCWRVGKNLKVVINLVKNAVYKFFNLRRDQIPHHRRWYRFRWGGVSRILFGNTVRPSEQGWCIFFFLHSFRFYVFLDLMIRLFARKCIIRCLFPSLNCFPVRQKESN